MRIIARGEDNHPTNFGVFIGRFVVDLSANTCQTRHVTLAFDFGDNDAGLRLPSAYRYWEFV